MNEPLQQSTAQGLNEADPAENLTTRGETCAALSRSVGQ